MKKIKTKNKLIGLCLSICLLLSCMAMVVFAADGVGYIDEKGVTQTYTGEIRTITADSTTLEAGWYVVSGTVTINDRIYLTSDTHIILEEGAALTALDGIDVTIETGSPKTVPSLTVYAQSQPVLKSDGTLDEERTTTGRLIASARGGQKAGIGSYQGDGGNITINGGCVSATGSTEGAGIGGGKKGNGGNITINGGYVTATGSSAAGIGGGNEGNGGNITINGGTVTANGNESSAGIGGGNEGNGGTITISGGTVTANGDTGAGIGGGYNGNGGTITISGGTITATGGESSAGIGGGDRAAGGTITISGGTVTAKGGGAGAGIGGGYNGNGGTITISGGTVTAKGGDSGAGIGGGSTSISGGNITIYDGTVTATGGKSGAGIGGGSRSTSNKETGAGGTITIFGGTVTAKGGDSGAGIGGGLQGAVGTVVIKGGRVKATGGNWGSGIGTGYMPASTTAGSVTISGGRVEAYGGNSGAGIGTGESAASDSSFGNITINGGTVIASSGMYAAGIGTGKSSEGSFGDITINGGTVTATGNTNGAGIGTGSSSKGSLGDITINGGVVNVKKGADYGSCIGAGNDSTTKYGTVYLNGGLITVYAINDKKFGRAPSMKDGVTWVVSNGSADDKLTVIEEPSSVNFTSKGNVIRISDSVTVHHADMNTTYVEAKSAACLVPGNITYWYCDHCKRYFTDAACSIEVSEDEVTLPAIGHRWVDGICANCGSECEGHAYVNGICPACGECQAAELVDGYYLISNVGQFLWFGEKINGEERSINGRLVEDIDLSDIDYTPISAPYRGTFDGNNHKISHMTIGTKKILHNGTMSYGYCGLFSGLGSGAVVKDLTITGTITCTEAMKYVGGLAGYINGGSKISNIQSYVNITSGSTSGANVERVGGITGYINSTLNFVAENCCYYGSINLDNASSVGGIVGYLTGTGNKVAGCVNNGSIYVNSGYHVGGIAGSLWASATVERCINEGSVELHSHDCLGGIVGYANSGAVIRNCGNVGSVKGISSNSEAPDAYVGGILGYVNHSNFGGITGCYNIGTLTAGGSDTYCGAIIGWGRNGATAGKITGNYYLEGTKAVGATNDTLVTATSVTSNQVTSGELAYLLNGGVTDGTQVWYQTIGRDAFPNFTGGTVYKQTSDNTYTNKNPLEVISVTITWTSMEFTYTDGDWNSDTHSYAEGTWSTSGGTVKVENKGNVAVTAEFTYTPETESGDYSGITGSFTKKSLDMAFGENGETALSFSGKPKAVMSGAMMGTITVTITEERE